VKVTKCASALAAGIALCTMTAPLRAVASPASAGPVFTVMNTSETQPDGVYLRNSAHTADTSRTYGLGVFSGEQVHLSCYVANGDVVGPYNDSLWYYVNNVTRPSVNGQPDQGYLNAHYINDGQNANIVDSGVPACGAGVPAPPVATPPPPQSTTRSVYYSPFSNPPSDPPFHQVADYDFPERDWSPNTGGACNSVPGRNVADGVSTLAGWSKGRLGPIYFLRSGTDAQIAAVHTIILFDPGNSSTFGGLSCDSTANPNVVLAKWLMKGPNTNRLFILSGHDTEEKRFKYFGRSTFNGLRRYYLGRIQGTALAKQTLICDYNNLSHQAVIDGYYGFVQSVRSYCPGGSAAHKLTAFHP